MPSALNIGFENWERPSSSDAFLDAPAKEKYSGAGAVQQYASGI
jgi:hypothetical protein